MLWISCEKVFGAILILPGDEQHRYGSFYNATCDNGLICNFLETKTSGFVGKAMLSQCAQHILQYLKFPPRILTNMGRCGCIAFTQYHPWKQSFTNKIL